MQDNQAATKTCECPVCTENASPTYTQEWMRACEIRDLADMPCDEDRARQLELVAAARGPEAAQALRVAVWEEILRRAGL